MKEGTGTLIVNGSNTCSGTFAILEGTLQQDSIHTGAGFTIVTNDAVITGNGSTDGFVGITSLATLAPSPQLTVTGDLFMEGTYAVDVSGAVIDQTLGISDLTFTTGSVLTVNGILTEPSYLIMTYTTRAGFFADIGSAAAQDYHVDYDDVAGEVRLVPHEAPKPGIELVGGEVILSWPGVAGFDYFVEHRTNMLVGTWTLYDSYTNLIGLSDLLFATNMPDDNTDFFRIWEEQ